MERLTQQNFDGEPYTYGTYVYEFPFTHENKRVFYGEAIDKLAAYEDTGLTPEEITLFVKCNAMQVSKRELQLGIENDRLKVKLDAAIEDIPHKCWKCKHAHCNTGNDCDIAHYVGNSSDCQSWEWRGLEDKSEI